MKKWVILLGLTIAMCFGAGYALAQGHGHGAGPGSIAHHEKGHPPDSMGPLEPAPLTPEQRLKFREIRRKFKIENGQLIGTIVGKRIELRALWSDPKTDPKTIVEKEKELAAFRFQLEEKIVQARLEARKFLTPEQISNFGRPGAMGHGFMGGHRKMKGHGGMMGRRGSGHQMKPEMGCGMGGGMVHGMGKGDMGKRPEGH